MAHTSRFATAIALTATAALSACGGSSDKKQDMSPANHAPVLTALTATPPTIPAGGQTTLSASATDADGDTLTYAWTLPSGWKFFDSTQSALSMVTVVAPNQAGLAATIGVAVSDGHGGNVSGTVVVGTSSPTGPVISSISAVPSLVKKGGTIHLAVSATDLAGLALTYAWSAPTGWTLTPSASGTTATLVAPSTSAENATITCTVTDAASVAVTASVLVATADNLPPVIASLSSDATQVLPGGVIHALVSATDPENDPLTYTWTASDTTWTITGTGTAVTITAPQQNGGSTHLTVTVSDGVGGSVSGTLLFTTTGCGAGALNCDKNDLNGCETDSTTTLNCGACGAACNVGQVCDHGSVCRAPSVSCEAMLEAGLSLGDGKYYIQPTGATAPIETYCDMTTDGGGWTGFYAGLNGSNNEFASFEMTARSCSDPATHCLQRLPADQANAEIMSTCGTAKIGFELSSQAADFFTTGAYQYWIPLPRARDIAGDGRADFATNLFAGDPYGDISYIISAEDFSQPSHTFASTGTNTNYSGQIFNYCNGVFDTSSPTMLLYRTRIDHLEIDSTVNQNTATPFDVTVRALDAYGQQVSGYTGTVHFTASNADVTLPADHTFIAGDAGSHTFTVSPTNTTGSRTYTVTDKAIARLTASASFQIATTGSSASPATDCATILAAGASGGDGVYWLTDGVGTYFALCDMTTDGGGWTAFFSGRNGQQNVFDHFENTAADCPFPATQCLRRIPQVGSPEVLATCGTAKAAFFLSAAGRNYFENGTQSNGWTPLSLQRAISGSPMLADLGYVWGGQGGNTGFMIGDQTGPGTFLSSYDQNNGFDYCNGANDNISYAALYYRSTIDHLVITASNPQSGAPFSITVAAVGKDGVPVPTYTGTVKLTSSDTGATLPATYTFTSTDGGKHVFTNGVTLAATTGSVTLTATDTTKTALTATTTIHLDALGSSAMPATSCLAIVTAKVSNGDGVYWLTDGVTPFQAYCDMTTDGGGWTLVLKANGANKTFLYPAALWTNATLLNPTAFDFDTQEAKLQSWNSVAFTQVLLDQQREDIGGDVTKIELTEAANSMFALMSPNMFVPTDAGRAAWEASMSGSSLQPNCNQEGFNNTGPGMEVRIGILGNNEGDCNSPDSRIGIGGDLSSCFGNANLSSGDISGCGGDNGDVSIATYGWVLVR